MAKIAQPSVWPLAFILCSQNSSVDWLGEEVCASGPKMDRVLEKLVREGGDVPLPEYVTILREDGSTVSLGPRLTQPCTSTKSGVFEVVTTARGPVAQLVQSKEVSNNVNEEEEFEEMLERRRANLNDEERVLEEQAEEDEDSEPKEEKEEPKKKEEAENFGGEEERRRRVHQRRRIQPGEFLNIFLALNLWLCPLSFLTLWVTLLPAGDHEPLRLRGGSGRGVGGLGGPRRRRPTVQQMKANSRMVHPEYLSQQDLYEFSRLDPGQFQVPS